MNPLPPPVLLLFTAALLLLTHTTPPISAATTLCPPCGTTQVPYPLSTDPTCGDPSYGIQCNAGKLLLPALNSSSYPIISISPQIQQLVIQPASILPNTCVTTDYSHEGIQLNTSLPFNMTSDNTIFYLNCSDLLLRSPLNCSSSSLCNLYENSSAYLAGSTCRDASLCCTYQIGPTTAYSVRVRDSGCKAYASVVNLDPTLPVSQWPNPGVQIQWASPQEPVCGSQTDCDGNSTCGPDPNGSGVLRCYCNAGLLWDPIDGICAENATCANPDGCGGSDRTALIAGLTSGIGVSLLVASIGVVLYKRYKRIREARERLAREREEILNAGAKRAAKLFTGKEIKKATDSFSSDRLLGIGGYGEVYKGVLEDGTVIAVKCAKLGNAKGTDQVLNEVRILCQVNHRSLVGLLGCCVELEQPIMVYEFVNNGTLLDHLQGLRPGGKGQLSWLQRLGVAHDTAEGLAYLHFSAVPPIYHRDVKSSNILLDENLNARVSDFGLSRLAHSDLSHISTCAQGTLGYLDPEYYRKYQLTDKSDVYSFGVVLLELLTSQKAIDFNRAEDDVNLAVYVQRLAEEEKVMDSIDPVMKEGASSLDLETIKALVFLALGCLEEKRQNRPSMKEVVEEIEYIMSIATSKKVESSSEIQDHLSKYGF